ncbi:glycosyltransferase family protein [Gephyromycinifex aptenodytis]|uniref:hypothetical protein n=1 Tax=Gephyromycinifex aptenodytis TaxID=2716227 RepID=UPI001D0048D7|nr:hypothetical protein [Gephyromycinifex aptenodytis]
MNPIRHLVVGPPQHGVTRHGAGIAAMHPYEVIRTQDAPASAELPTDGLLHLHVTDRLFGSGPQEAAEAVLAIAAQRACSLTLHDLPQPSDGPTNHPRRAQAYARMAAASVGVIVASEHEAGLLRAACELAGVKPVRIEVVPLPIDVLPLADVAGAAARAAAVRPRQIGVLGFLYPGKGHDLALEACASCPADVGLLALGRPSPGHEDLVEELTARAEVLGRTFEISGYVPDDQLTDRLRSIAVPVAPHEHLSASGSIGSWIAAGRRPLVPSSAYVAELQARNPQSVLEYGPDAPAGSPPSLREALQAALQDPALTWLPPGTQVGPTSAEAAAAYAAILRRWAQ